MIDIPLDSSRKDDNSDLLKSISHLNRGSIKERARLKEAVL